jgi:hypothetical protein
VLLSHARRRHERRHLLPGPFTSPPLMNVATCYPVRSPPLPSLRFVGV